MRKQYENLHICNFQKMLKISVFYLTNKKAFFLKKYDLGCSQYQNKTALFTDPIFSDGFVLNIIALSSVCLSCSIAVLTENIRSASQTFQTAVDWRYAFNQPTRHNNWGFSMGLSIFPKTFRTWISWSRPTELKVKKKCIY